MNSSGGPGTCPIGSATASSPLNQLLLFVWSAAARIDAAALPCATTQTSPFATVPVDGSVDVTVELTGNGIGKNKSGGVMVVVLDNAAGEDEALLLEAAVGQGKPAKPGKPEKPGKPAKP